MKNESALHPVPQDVAVLVAYIKHLLASDDSDGKKKEPAAGAGKRA